MAETQAGTVYIVNSRRLREWERRSRGFDTHDTQLTQHAGHARELARRAAAEGRGMVVAVGGDGSLNEVVDGLMQHAVASSALPSSTAVALVPLGTGSDFRRTLGLSREPGAALERLASSAAAQPQPIDVCRLTCQALNGSDQQITRYFVNVCSAGVSGVAAPLINRRRWLGPKLAYSLAGAQALLCMRRQDVELRIDGGEWLHVPALTLMAVGNGRYFGGGMCICPGADIRSGSLQVTVLSGLGLLDFLRYQSKLRSGSLAEVPHGVQLFTARERVELRPIAGASSTQAPAAAPIPVECDGELVGRVPLTIDILPGALRFCC